MAINTAAESAEKSKFFSWCLRLFPLELSFFVNKKNILKIHKFSMFSSFLTRKQKRKILSKHVLFKLNSVTIIVFVDFNKISNSVSFWSPEKIILEKNDCSNIYNYRIYSFIYWRRSSWRRAFRNGYVLRNGIGDRVQSWTRLFANTLEKEMSP